MNYTIAGHSVDFPHQAYGPQLSFMERVLKALQGPANALLEAPTGSGKTLSLLCAALVWQRSKKEDRFAQLQAEQEAAAAAAATEAPDLDEFRYSAPSEVGRPADDEVPGAGTVHPHPRPKRDPLRIPKIYYATRTHSQIAQVVRELKRTKYRPKMAILASRQQYCIHKTVSKKVNLDEECAELLKDGADGGSSCRFFINVGKMIGLQNSAALKVHDIEDLCNEGRRHTACPYFTARHFAQEAELIFCPYSYLLDPVVRAAMDVELQGAVLIFDEAHNIEDTCRDAASADLELATLADVQAAYAEALPSPDKPELFPMLGAAFGDLVAWLQGVAAGRHMAAAGFERTEAVWSGQEAMRQLEAAGLGPARVEALWELYREARAAEEAASAPGGGGGEAAGQLPGVGRAGAFALGVTSRLLTVLRLMYSAGAAHVRDYRLVVQQWVRHAPPAPKSRSRRARRDEDEEGGAMDAHGMVTQLCLWSLNPAVAFKEVSDKALAVVLTSGTLAPMASFASELGVPFPIRLESPHVVDMARQVWCGALGSAPSGAPLTATFKCGDTFAFQDGVGATLLRAAELVPGGLLVFLPSYSLLDRFMARWKATGALKQLNALKKVVCEPRGTGEAFDTVMADFYAAVKEGRGALFLAVCRGKVSEGLDFADANARAVIVVGIPFPAVKDTKVRLKKEYNDEGQRTRGLLNGDQWYMQQAFRALNQAVGRCIRHRGDYGAILLLDSRFREGRYQKHLSRWVRGALAVQPGFDAAQASVAAFFKRIAEAPPPQVAAAAAAAGTPQSSKAVGPKTAASSSKGTPAAAEQLPETLASASQPTIAALWKRPPNLEQQLHHAQLLRRQQQQQLEQKEQEQRHQAHAAQQKHQEAQQPPDQGGAPPGDEAYAGLGGFVCSPLTSADPLPTPAAGRGAEAVLSSMVSQRPSSQPLRPSHSVASGLDTPCRSASFSFTTGASAPPQRGSPFPPSSVEPHLCTPASGSGLTADAHSDLPLQRSALGPTKTATGACAQQLCNAQHPSRMVVQPQHAGASVRNPHGSCRLQPGSASSTSSAMRTQVPGSHCSTVGTRVEQPPKDRQPTASHASSSPLHSATSRTAGFVSQLASLHAATAHSGVVLNGHHQLQNHLPSHSQQQQQQQQQQDFQLATAQLYRLPPSATAPHAGGLIPGLSDPGISDARALDPKAIATAVHLGQLHIDAPHLQRWVAADLAEGEAYLAGLPLSRLAPQAGTTMSQQQLAAEGILEAFFMARLSLQESASLQPMLADWLCALPRGLQLAAAAASSTAAGATSAGRGFDTAAADVAAWLPAAQQLALVPLVQALETAYRAALQQHHQDQLCPAPTATTRPQHLLQPPHRPASCPTRSPAAPAAPQPPASCPAAPAAPKPTSRISPTAPNAPTALANTGLAQGGQPGSSRQITPACQPHPAHSAPLHGVSSGTAATAPPHIGGYSSAATMAQPPVVGPVQPQGGGGAASARHGAVHVSPAQGGLGASPLPGAAEVPARPALQPPRLPTPAGQTVQAAAAAITQDGKENATGKRYIRGRAATEAAEKRQRLAAAVGDVGARQAARAAARSAALAPGSDDDDDFL